MCANYEPADPGFEAFIEFPKPQFDYRPEVWKDYVAPILRKTSGMPTTDPASFGMVPRRHIPPGVRVFDTMNARSESVGEKRSFSGAWKGLQLCLIPCKSIFEPNYESGKAVRWRIGMADGSPFAVAGLWRAWKEADGATALSFTMLTINSAEHPLMKRFHKPGDEKRSVVIIPATEYDDWLSCRSTDEARSFLGLYPAACMRAAPAPRPPSRATGPSDVDATE